MTGFRTNQKTGKPFRVRVEDIPVWERAKVISQMESEVRKRNLLVKARKKEERAKRRAEAKKSYDITESKVLEFAKTNFPNWIRDADFQATAFGLSRAHQNEPRENFLVNKILRKTSDEGKLERNDSDPHAVYYRWVSDE